MPVPVRAACVRPPASRIRAAARVAGAAFAVALIASACGSASNDEPLAPPAAPPGQPAGTLIVPVGDDVATVVQRVRDAITATGGTVVTVIDHTADAGSAGVRIPASTEVIGGAPPASLALLRVDQRAAADLPQRYLVRQAADGSVTLATNSADYVAAVSRVSVPDAPAALDETTTAVVDEATGPDTALPAPLVGVTPVDYLIARPSAATIAATVDRLRRGADRGATRTIAVVDMAAGAADAGPALRPTTLVLVGAPAAAAPLLAAAPTFGLDLPLRFVVWADDQNRTQIGYPDPRRLAARHGLTADDPDVVRLAAEADRLAGVGAGTTVSGAAR